MRREAQRAWQRPGDATHLTWPELADSFSFLMFFVFVWDSDFLSFLARQSILTGQPKHF